MYMELKMLGRLKYIQLSYWYTILVPLMVEMVTEKLKDVD
jgi:hypothetical protein